MTEPAENVTPISQGQPDEKQFWRDLRAEFSPDEIHWRVGATSGDKTKGMALAYIDARNVMDRLDRVVGPGGWTEEYECVPPRVICTIKIRTPSGEWLGKTDAAGDTQVEAEKGAFSDAFKRAAVKWGIGRYLYDLPSPWVVIETYGKSSKIKKGQESILHAAARNTTAPAGSASSSSPSHNPTPSSGGSERARSSAEHGAPTPPQTQAQNAPRSASGEINRELLAEVKARLQEGDIHEVWKANFQAWMKAAGNQATRVELSALYADMSN